MMTPFPKIASLILRDVVYIYELENILETKDYYYLQPVDTWVHQISRHIGIVEKDEIYKNESLDIVNKCHEFGVNPIHYNQGAWYIGANSHKIIMSNINSKENELASNKYSGCGKPLALLGIRKKRKNGIRSEKDRTLGF